MKKKRNHQFGNCKPFILFNFLLIINFYLNSFSGLFGSKNQELMSARQQQTLSTSAVEQVVPYSELNNNQVPEKVAKAYEFLVKEK